MSIFDVEKLALVGDKNAIIHLVSEFRRLRLASDKLLKSRYRDGECDSVSLHEFNSVYKEMFNEDADTT